MSLPLLSEYLPRSPVWQALCRAMLGVGNASDPALPSKAPQSCGKPDTDTNGEGVVIGGAQGQPLSR